MGIVFPVEGGAELGGGVGVAAAVFAHGRVDDVLYIQTKDALVRHVF